LSGALFFNYQVCWLIETGSCHCRFHDTPLASGSSMAYLPRFDQDTASQVGVSGVSANAFPAQWPCQQGKPGYKVTSPVFTWLLYERNLIG